MKKHLLLLLVLCLSVYTATAQNYSPIVTGNTSIYEKGFEGDYALHVDSITTDPKGTAYHFIKTWSEKTQNCNTYHQSTWAGPKCVVSGNTFYFFNKDNDTITFKPSSELNSKWKVYKYPDGRYFEGEVTAKTQRSLFNTIIDSVRTITIRLKNEEGEDISGSPSPNYVFSKEHGMLELWELNEFPSSVNYFYLRGMSNPKIGKQLMTPRTIFDYDIGDEFHYQIHTGGTTNGVYTQKTHSIIGIEGSVEGPEITYTIKRRRKTLVEDITDTITETHVFDDIIYYPQQAIKETNPSSFYFGMSSFDQGTIFNGPTGWTYFNTQYEYITYMDDCWNFPIITTPINLSYVNGLGLTSKAPMFGIDSEILVYYKKGTEEWGQPLVLSNYTKASNTTFTLYPNPLQQGGTLHLQSDHFTATQWTIFNSQGIQVYESKNKVSIQSVDLNELEPGIYLVRLVNPKNEMINSKLLIK